MADVVPVTIPPPWEITDGIRKLGPLVLAGMVTNPQLDPDAKIAALRTLVQMTRANLAHTSLHRHDGGSPPATTAQHVHVHFEGMTVDQAKQVLRDRIIRIGSDPGAAGGAADAAGVGPERGRRRRRRTDAGGAGAGGG